MKINPPYSRFIIFSGGGGLLLREQTIQFSAGRNIIEVQDVPSSFDEDTVTVELENTNAKLVQVVVKKPDRRFVEDAMRREREASERILTQAVDIRTELREELLHICEGIRSYQYEDSFSDLIVTVDSSKESTGKIKISYFMDDKRIWWSPNIQIDMNEDGARITGYILVENQTNLRFGDVELEFAEFEGTSRRAGPPPAPGAPPPAVRREMLTELKKLRRIK